MRRCCDMDSGTVSSPLARRMVDTQPAGPPDAWYSAITAGDPVGWRPPLLVAAMTASSRWRPRVPGGGLA
jgi:hypothetical protein